MNLLTDSFDERLRKSIVTMRVQSRCRLGHERYGIRYLKKLDTLSVPITHWENFNNHEAFKEQIIQAHGRKRSFWSNYEVKI